MMGYRSRHESIRREIIEPIRASGIVEHHAPGPEQHR